MAVTQVPPPAPWVQPDGSPTLAFFKFIYNLFQSTPAGGVATDTIQSNITGTVSAPIANSLSAILNALISNARGSILVRGVAAWTGLALGSTGKALVSNGTDLVYGGPGVLANAVTLEAGAPASITTAGGDLKLDSATHILQVGTTMTAAAVPALFSATHILAIKDGSGTTYYIPAATATW